eukprot:2299657-Rhodomonas_salina.1
MMVPDNLDISADDAKGCLQASLGTPPITLCLRYALSCTGVACTVPYASSVLYHCATRCPVLTLRMLLPGLHSGGLEFEIRCGPLRAYAAARPCTDLSYAASPCGTDLSSVRCYQVGGLRARALLPREHHSLRSSTLAPRVNFSEIFQLRPEISQLSAYRCFRRRGTDNVVVDMLLPVLTWAYAATRDRGGDAGGPCRARQGSEQENGGGENCTFRDVRALRAMSAYGAMPCSVVTQRMLLRGAKPSRVHEIGKCRLLRECYALSGTETSVLYQKMAALDACVRLAQLGKLKP